MAKTKKEKLQEQATGLGIQFEDITTIKQLEALIKAAKPIHVGTAPESIKPTRTDVLEPIRKNIQEIITTCERTAKEHPAVGRRVHMAAKQLIVIQKRLK